MPELSIASSLLAASIQDQVNAALVKELGPFCEATGATVGAHIRRYPALSVLRGEASLVIEVQYRINNEVELLWRNDVTFMAHLPPGRGPWAIAALVQEYSEELLQGLESPSPAACALIPAVKNRVRDLELNPTDVMLDAVGTDAMRRIAALIYLEA